jgi:hypothetical protein
MNQLEELATSLAFPHIDILVGKSTSVNHRRSATSMLRMPLTNLVLSKQVCAIEGWLKRHIVTESHTAGGAVAPRGARKPDKRIVR